MKAGEFPDGAHVLRLKIDLASPNINMRDPAIYRIRHASHHRTGDKWCIYPLYDYTHCISDALERITHSICTLEFQDHRPLYDWVLARLADGGQLPRPLPQQHEFARLNLTHVLLSKRKLIELVAQHDVDGWDDPRMPTLVGARRRGFTPEGFRLFAERIGVSKSDSWIDMSVLEDCMREDLNARAPRRMAVLDPVRLVIDNYPRRPGGGLPRAQSSAAARARQARDAVLARALDRARRLPGERAEGLFPARAGRRSAAALRLHRPLRRRRQGCRRQRRRRPLHVRSRHAHRHARRRRAQGQGQHPLAVGGARAAGRSAALRSAVRRAVSRGAPPAGRALPARRREVVVAHATVVAGDDVDDVAEPVERNWLDDLNPDSKRVITAFVEPALGNVAAGEAFQFERHGYFVADLRDHAPGKPVYNRTVTLRDSWAQR